VKDFDWTNERYVRLYTKDTVGWQLLPWQARTCYYALKRRCDAEGVIDVGTHGIRGLALAALLPVEIAEAGIAALVEDQWLSWDPIAGHLVIFGHSEAETAVASAASRARLYRERRRAGGRG
jgi:hypothetical protein